MSRAAIEASRLAELGSQREQAILLCQVYADISRDLQQQLADVQVRLTADDYEDRWGRERDEDLDQALVESIDTLTNGPVSVDRVSEVPRLLFDELARRSISSYGMRVPGGKEQLSWPRLRKLIDAIDSDIAELQRLQEPESIAGKFRLKPRTRFGRAKGGDVVQLTVAQARAFGDLFDSV